MIKGQRELARLMQHIPARVQKNLTAGVIRAATTVFVKAARQNAENLQMVAPGKKTLKRAIVNRQPRYVRGEMVGGVRIQKDAWWWRYFEFGTNPRWRGTRRYIVGTQERWKVGAMRRKQYGVVDALTPGYTGAIKPQPFVRPALDENIEEAMAAATRHGRERALAEIIKK